MYHRAFNSYIMCHQRSKHIGNVFMPLVNLVQLYLHIHNYTHLYSMIQSLLKARKTGGPNPSIACTKQIGVLLQSEPRPVCCTRSLLQETLTKLYRPGITNTLRISILENFRRRDRGVLCICGCMGVGGCQSWRWQGCHS